MSVPEIQQNLGAKTWVTCNTHGTHCLKTLSKNLIYKIGIPIQGFLEEWSGPTFKCNLCYYFEFELH